MTDKQILATANATGVMLNRFVVDKKQFEFCLLAFAKQIAKLEREACAKVCDDAIFKIWEYDPVYLKLISRTVCTNLAKAIRARGEA